MAGTLVRDTILGVDGLELDIGFCSRIGGTRGRIMARPLIRICSDAAEAGTDAIASVPWIYVGGFLIVRTQAIAWSRRGPVSAGCRPGYETKSATLVGADSREALPSLLSRAGIPPDAVMCGVRRCLHRASGSSTPGIRDCGRSARGSQRRVSGRRWHF
eukprot:gene16050-biopygen9295